MKKISFAFFILLLASGVIAQNNKNDSLHKAVYVIYDFNKPGIPYRMYQYQSDSSRKNIQKVWYGKGVNLDLVLNPYLYDLNVTCRQAMEDAPDDGNGKQAFEASFKAINKFDSGIQQTKNDQQQNNIEKKNNNTISENTLAETPIKSSITDLANVQPELKKDLKRDPSLISTFGNYNIETLQLNKSRYTTQVQDFITNISSAYTYLQTRDLEDDRRRYSDARENFNKAKYLFDSSLASFDNYVQTCKAAMLIILTDGLTEKEILAKIDTLFKYNISYTIQQYTSYAAGNINYYKNDLDKNFQNLSSAYNDLEDTNDSLIFKQARKFNSDSILFKQYDSGYKKISMSKVDIVSNSLVNILNYLQTSNAFINRFTVTFAKQDSVIFNIRLTKSKRYDSLITLYGIKPKFIDTLFTYPIPVKGGFKLDFSVGMSFLYGKLRKATFYYEPNKEDSLSEFIRKGKYSNRYQPVVSAFAHAYLRLGGWLTPAITVGISTNPTDLSNSSFMLGGSLILGHSNRFVATFGIAGSSVDYLKSKYQKDKSYLKTDMMGVSETDLVEKTFKSGVFFGFSYNLSKK